VVAINTTSVAARKTNEVVLNLRDDCSREPNPCLLRIDPIISVNSGNLLPLSGARMGKLRCQVFICLLMKFSNLRIFPFGFRGLSQSLVDLAKPEMSIGLIRS
jgi:hypothetical protein